MSGLGRVGTLQTAVARSITRGRTGSSPSPPVRRLHPSGIIGPMTGQSAVTAIPRRGVLRLVVLAITLAGFAALHALGSTAGHGTHCDSAPALMLVEEAQATTEERAAHAALPVNGDASAHAGAPAPDHTSGGLTTGCLLALFGAMVLIGLRLLRRFGTDTTSPRVRHTAAWLHAARAPPPLFLSLCVFRL